MGKVVGAILLGIMAILCFIFSYRQFHGKGFLFNNAYIYASKKERETMDKKSHYEQSGVVFALIGFIFFLNTLDMIFQTSWILYLVIAMVIITMGYAVVSTVIIEKREKEK